MLLLRLDLGLGRSLLHLGRRRSSQVLLPQGQHDAPRPGRGRGERRLGRRGRRRAVAGGERREVDHAGEAPPREEEGPRGGGGGGSGAAASSSSSSRCRNSCRNSTSSSTLCGIWRWPEGSTLFIA